MEKARENCEHHRIPIPHPDPEHLYVDDVRLFMP